MSSLQAKPVRTASIPIGHLARMKTKVPVSQEGPRGTGPKCVASPLRPAFFVAEAAGHRKVRSLDSRASASSWGPSHREDSSASQPAPHWHAAKWAL